MVLKVKLSAMEKSVSDDVGSQQICINTRRQIG